MSTSGFNTLKLKRNDKSLASKIVKYPNQLPLTSYIAPTYNEEDAEILKVNRNNNQGGLTAGPNSGILKKTNTGCIIQDNLQFAQALNSTTFTNSEAQQLSYPYSIPTYAMDTIAEAVVHRLTSTRNAIKWAHLPDLKYVLPYIDNSTAVLTAKPADGEEPKCKWQGDLRFTGEWWVCLEEREEALKKDQQMYEPLFVSSGKWNSKVEENQFLVELMKQLIYGRRYYFELIHIDNFPLTAERLHVFFFNGLLEILESSFIKFEEKCIIANRHIHGWEKDGSKVGENVYTALGDRRKRGKLEEESVLYLATLSFSICQINTAALFILLTALSTPKAGNLITNLDISFNLLDGNSFYTLSQLLPLTHVCRLSLRGNNLGCENTTSFREFLVDACSASHTSKPALNELDFSATQLSYKQVCVLIECIPLMKGLHQLLLDGVDIPSSKTSALKDAVSESNIYFLSLKNIPEISTNTIYLQELEEICERNRRRVLGANAAEDEGFFRKFFERGRQKGWRPTGYSALPEGYQPFTNNDPSLWLDN